MLNTSSLFLKLFPIVAVVPSMELGLLSSDGITMSGDGTCVHTHANPNGKNVGDLKNTQSLWQSFENIQKKLISLVQKKLAKGNPVEQIAEALEENVETIQDIIAKLKEQN